VPNAAVFDCSSRSGSVEGSAFSINNSTVYMTGIIFQNCSNPITNGGAVSAVGSSVAVSQCSFFNCRAVSSGAIFVRGPGNSLFLSVQNSYFSCNSANGGSAGCPAISTQPCSSWGGAVAAFEVFNVTVSGCTMVDNQAVARSFPQIFSSVAGGGCLSLLFQGNATGTAVLIRGNVFRRCVVTVPSIITRGNGVYKSNKHRCAMFALCCVLLIRRIRQCSLGLFRPLCRNAAAGRVAFQTRAPGQRVH
jgi:hypothetical protein